MKQELTGTRYNITSEATGLRFYVTGIIGFVITSKTKLKNTCWKQFNIYVRQDSNNIALNQLLFMLILFLIVHKMNRIKHDTIDE